MAAAAAGQNEPKLFYQLKVTLKYTKPPIWRRFIISEKATCKELADWICKSMGWDGYPYHLYQFDAGNLRITVVHGDSLGFDDIVDMDIKTTSVKTLFEKGRKSVKFLYDFGDNWDHEVKLEKIISGETKTGCVAGKRAGPPEDCGGICCYYELLEILKNPGHEDYTERKEWLEGVGYENYDPEHFDLEKVAAAIGGN